MAQRRSRLAVRTKQRARGPHRRAHELAAGGLKGAISRGEVGSFDRLAHLSDRAFYADERGLHYAQARYLLYYLQEKGVLRDFYRTARAARAKDPSGYQALVKALGARDMAAFQARWQRYVEKLQFADPLEGGPSS